MMRLVVTPADRGYLVEAQSPGWPSSALAVLNTETEARNVRLRLMWSMATQQRGAS